MDEVGVVGQAYLQVVSLNFIGNFHNKVLEDPLYVPRSRMPLQVTQDYEVVDPRVAVGEESLQHRFLHIIIQLQADQVFHDAYVLLMAVVSRSFVLAFLFVDGLHLFLKPHFINNTFHLTGVKGLVGTRVHAHRHAWEVVVRRHHVGKLMGVHW